MRITLVLILFSALYFTSCKTAKPPVQFAKDDLPSITDTLRHLSIEWDTAERKISHDVYFAEYGRIRRYNGDTIILVYHFGEKGHEWDNIAMRKSDNNGETWGEAQVVVKDDQPERYHGFSTPDLIVLKNKKLILAYTGKGIPDDTTHNDLQICSSDDGGKTWGKPKKIAIGRSWEPGMVQLPNGEIQLFFSNELTSSNGAKGRHEQQILMMRSTDDGETWSRPMLVAFTPKIRDGMPVPLVLADNKGIVVPMEVVENRQSPEIIWSSMEANWNYKDIGTLENGRRWHGSVDPVWGGAPSLVQLPTGETIMVMQTEGGRKIDRYKGWKKNTVAVMVGNSMAKNFGSLTFPYPNQPITEGRYFCSLFLKNDSTLVLVSTRNFEDQSSALYWKEGKISGHRK